MKIRGDITHISEPPSPDDYQKIDVTINTGYGQIGFLEFQSADMALLKDLKVNDYVEVVILLKGSVSKTTGVRYNNLVAKAITKLP